MVGEQKGKDFASSRPDDKDVETSNLCQDCTSLTASPPSSPVPNTAPPPTSLSNLANTQRIKREEAIQRVQAMC
ncbi:hypothetical protein H4Q26_010153 [Puccinia striiformis f. sp. tritici PST-130]|nr:hypothetical protein H4Q26_010153 [Puccinia striiformis f. sp. tritici PST-130]